MNTDNIENLLTPYALGDLDAQTARRVESHLAAHPEARETLAEIQATLGLLREALARPLPAGLDKLEAHRRAQVLELPTAPARLAARAATVPFFSRWLRMAATLAVTCGAAWFGIRHYLGPNQGSMDEHSYHAAKPAAAPPVEAKNENAKADMNPPAVLETLEADAGAKKREEAPVTAVATPRQAVIPATPAPAPPALVEESGTRLQKFTTPLRSAEVERAMPTVSEEKQSVDSPVSKEFHKLTSQRVAGEIPATMPGSARADDAFGSTPPPRSTRDNSKTGPPQSVPPPGLTGQSPTEADSRTALDEVAPKGVRGGATLPTAQNKAGLTQPAPEGRLESQFSQETLGESNALEFFSDASKDDLSILGMEQGNFQAFNSVGPRGGGSYQSLYPGLRARPGKILSADDRVNDDRMRRSGQAKDLSLKEARWCYGFTRPYDTLPASLDAVRRAGNQGLELIAQFPERWAASFDYAPSGARIGGMRFGMRKIQAPLPRTSLLVILTESGPDPVSATFRILMNPGAASEARLVGYPNPDVMRIPGDHAAPGSLAIAVFELRDASGTPPWGRMEVEWSTPGNAGGREVLPLQDAGLGHEDALWAGATTLVADALARKDVDEARVWTRVLAGHPRNLKSSREAALVRSLGELLAPADAGAEAESTGRP